MPQKKINGGRSARMAVIARRQASDATTIRKRKEDKWNSDIKELNKRTGGFGGFTKAMIELAEGGKESYMLREAKSAEKRAKDRAVEMEKKYLADREEMKRRLRRKK